MENLFSRLSLTQHGKLLSIVSNTVKGLTGSKRCCSITQPERDLEIALFHHKFFYTLEKKACLKGPLAFVF